MKNLEFIEENLMQCDISYRGGSMKIDVSELFDTGDEPAEMGAYQNYLGGGMAGSIQTGRSFDISEFTPEDLGQYKELAQDCIQWFYNENNGGGDDYMQENHTGSEAEGLERLQAMPGSAF